MRAQSGLLRRPLSISLGVMTHLATGLPTTHGAHGEATPILNFGPGFLAGKVIIWPPNCFEGLTQTFGAKDKVTEQLYIDSKNIKKCNLSLWLFGEVNFAIITNRDMDNFVHFLQFFSLFK